MKTTKENRQDLVWKKQLNNSIRDVEELKKYITLTKKEANNISKVINTYKMSITPYYASLMNKKSSKCPIRRMVLPNIKEICSIPRLPDMEQETSFEKARGLRQEFKKKCTILLTLSCPNYCRYCFRKYWVGRTSQVLTYKEIDNIVEILKNKSEIEEICLSGGDPLILSDEYISYVIKKIKEIKHVEVVRLYTRTLAFLPHRITDNLVNILKKHKGLYVCTHFNHPKEITPLTSKAIRKLVDNGIPVLNQSVLLKGVNDKTSVMRELLWKLVKNKVKPFYLQHCIRTMGNDYLVTKVDVGQKIIKDLYCDISTLAIPLYDVILYGGKALMMPNYLKTNKKGEKYFTNKKGEKFYLKDMESR